MLIDYARYCSARARDGSLFSCSSMRNPFRRGKERCVDYTVFVYKEAGLTE